MTKKEMIREVAEKTNSAQNHVGAIVNAIEDTVVDHIKQGGEVKLFNGVTLYAAVSAPRTSRNPQTGEPIDVPAKNVMRLKVGNRIKNLLNE